MNIADVARQNAIPLEVKKDGLQQRQNGDWVLRLVVQAADMDPRITNAAMGTRFQAALVEIDENEEPKKQRLDWRDVQPSAQAGIRCADPRFREFLAKERGFNTTTEDEAATVVRQLCQVNTRAAFSTNPAARTRWQALDNQYREWAHL
ncbi:MAG: hypothetical protein JWP25_4642 [Bradyrhizobium sp.]|nr:hypothetical protein [Bradyrhizobium sp.]